MAVSAHGTGEIVAGIDTLADKIRFHLCFHGFDIVVIRFGSLLSCFFLLTDIFLKVRVI